VLVELLNESVGRKLSFAEKDAAAYTKAWGEFGAVIKEGLYEDFERRDQLLGLARFATTKGSEPRSLKEVVADFKPNQTAIYYLVGDTAERLRSSPKLEAARARGIEVLLLTDPVDAFWTSQPLGYEGKPFKSLSQGDVDFGLIEPLETEKKDEPASDGNKVDEAVLIAALKSQLGERVSDVRASQRLTDSAACLVAQGAGPDRELDRLLSRQNRGVGTKPILEINPKHALVKAASAAKASGRTSDLADLAELLLDQAHVLDGDLPTDPAAFVNRLNRLVARGLPTG
jgi:molecular chaperone HtpG